MKTTKILPIGFLTLGLIGSGVMIATAQNLPPLTPDDQAQVQMQSQKPMQRADYRDGKAGRDSGKGDRMGRHEKRGGHGMRGGDGMRGGGEMFRGLFAQIDADGNGSVTQEEVDAFRAAKVTEADVSGDGALSIEEFDTLYREFTRSRMVDMFQDLDADGDGVISPEEADARFGDVVNRMDRDNDGALTLTDKAGRR
ncbi:Ca2+-binding protein, EF-hand superfamily [Aliiroseovarius sediminilitoris]|uniref:Ca2+-binding protein, EF-hand superfamily n=1 Tax=Aliiroseovarius sediminilitoris TaxID=1173584 RepID=A0A1I0R4Z0_9RHOB|nr:EF-hand domain-containing protein [Aliiroseovarius sediminilitoris]SEW35602.1 Ca2+-binding protein, EF-hand superfamily [Aliiroseovarius sediminilitoris]